MPWDLRALLDAVEEASPVEAADVLTTQLARMIDAEDVSFLIADLSSDAVTRFGTEPVAGHGNGERLDQIPIAGTPYERVMRGQQVVVERDGRWARLYAPVTNRGDVLGVLELALPTPVDEETVGFAATAAQALAYVVIANRRHTDLFERGQRSAPFSLAAEIQRRLLPSTFTCETAAFTLAGWLEPANRIGGDTFDYSLERDRLHLSISDAMGHAVDAAQLATLAVSSLRNSRRSQAGVLEQAQRANVAVAQHATNDGFVTAVLLRVDLATGLVTAVNAGHPAPYLVRDDAVQRVHLEPDLPLGMLPESSYREHTLELLPGDRLVLVTDGVLERNAATIEVARSLLTMGELHPREVVHSLARQVVAATGADLHDDATVMCVDWYGPQARPRNADAGASRERASAA